MSWISILKILIKDRITRSSHHNPLNYNEHFIITACNHSKILKNMKIFNFQKLGKSVFCRKRAIQTSILVYVYIWMKNALCTFYQSLWSSLLTFSSPKSDNCSIFRLQVCLGVSPWYFCSLSLPKYLQILPSHACWPSYGSCYRIIVIIRFGEP